MASPEAVAEARTFSPESGQARLYVVRRSTGAGVFPVVLNGHVLGGLGYATFLMTEVRPGEYAVQSNTRASVARLEFDAQADSVYFVEVYRRTGIWELLGVRSERVGLRRLGDSEGRRLVSDCRRVQAEAMHSP